MGSRTSSICPVCFSVQALLPLKGLSSTETPSHREINIVKDAAQSLAIEYELLLERCVAWESGQLTHDSILAYTGGICDTCSNADFSHSHKLGQSQFSLETHRNLIDKAWESVLREFDVLESKMSKREEYLVSVMESLQPVDTRKHVTELELDKFVTAHAPNWIKTLEKHGPMTLNLPADKPLGGREIEAYFSRGRLAKKS